jgi:hypothetical protein
MDSFCSGTSPVGDHLKAAKSCQQLAISASAAIASFWSEERSQKVFGAGHYRAGWFLLDDDVAPLLYQTLNCEGPLGQRDRLGGCSAITTA